MSEQFKSISVQVHYHGKDEEIFNDAVEMTGDELRAVVRHLSSIRISEIEDRAVLPMKNLHDMILRICKKKPGLE